MCLEPSFFTHLIGLPTRLWSRGMGLPKYVATRISSTSRDIVVVGFGQEVTHALAVADSHALHAMRSQFTPGRSMISFPRAR